MWIEELRRLCSDQPCPPRGCREFLRQSSSRAEHDLVAIGGDWTDTLVHQVSTKSEPPAGGGFARENTDESLP